MARFELLDKDDQVLTLKDVLQKLITIRAYILGTGSEEYAKDCDTIYRQVGYVISGMENKVPQWTSAKEEYPHGANQYFITDIEGHTYCIDRIEENDVLRSNKDYIKAWIPMPTAFEEEEE